MSTNSKIYDILQLCSIILRSFPVFGFLLWPSHDVHQCLLIQISLAILGRQPLGPVIGFIRWVAYQPILFASFSYRTWISLGEWPWLVISSMMSLRLAVSQMAGFCTSCSVTLSQHVYALMKVCYGGLHFNATLLSSLIASAVISVINLF